MTRIALSLGVFLLGITLVACAPKAAPVEKPETPVFRVQEPGAPGVTLAAEVEGEAKWQKIVQEARKEGMVVIYGPTVGGVRVPLQEAFAKAYPGIDVDISVMGGATLVARLKGEKGAGIHYPDLAMSGTTTILSGVRAFAQPIAPFLILPEVKDPKAWMGGRLDFADKAGEVNLVFAYNSTSSWAYNTELVDPKEIVSWWDLAKPKWKGKIIMFDPKTSGAGNATASMWYLNPELGLGFMKALAASGPVITRDRRLLVESVARGKYLIGVSPQSGEMAEFTKAGAAVKWGPVMKEGGHVTPSSGSIAVLDKPPHPNALTVFLNWMLGKEGMTIWSKTVDYYVRRLDVNQDHLPSGVTPEPGSKYAMLYKEDIVMNEKVDRELQKDLEKIFGP